MYFVFQETENLWQSWGATVQYILLTANEHFEEVDFIDSSIHMNKFNEPVAECTDNVQNFLDNFGF